MVAACSAATISRGWRTSSSIFWRSSCWRSTTHPARDIFGRFTFNEVETTYGYGVRAAFIPRKKFTLIVKALLAPDRTHAPLASGTMNR